MLPYLGYMSVAYPILGPDAPEWSKLIYNVGWILVA